MVVIANLSRVRVTGPMEAYVAGFETELSRLGFTPYSAAAQVRLMAHVSRWLDTRNLGVSNLTVGLIEEFFEERRRSYTAFVSPRALQPLVRWLAATGAIAAQTALPRPVQDPPVLTRFEQYLRTERRLQEISVQAQVSRIRRFLNGYTPGGGIGALTAAEVTQALLDEGNGRQPVSVKKFGYVLRSFLRYCLLTGDLDRDLTGATLVVRLPQPSLLPVGVDANQIQRLLEACDRHDPTGKRDYAILLLLARLGIRAGEVAGLRLEDLDWHTAEVLIRGKGAKDERLPVSAELGEALVDYLHIRPRMLQQHEVFCTVKAPWRRLSSPAVWAIVTRACQRAGLEPFSPHRLRRSLAESMINADISLAAIGQVLRHDDPVTTANYARVDVTRLRTIAQPWPAEGGLS
ncbi:tyrosine-type recombinase/integrase [Yaniella flava]|uniref:Tyrosine-type recombinase/integrase n=1 Tax=Yaniella flava TaxID=287930 RepID=A0ABP5GKM1_9MICC